MSSAKSALILLGVSAFAANIVVGCSGDDSRVGYEDLNDSGPGASLPDARSPETNDAAPSPQDSGRPKEAGDDAGDDSGYEVPDAADSGETNTVVDGGADADAGGDKGEEGSACPTKDLVQQQACGLCGVQYRLCAPTDRDAGSPNVWQPWGYCQNELVDGCEPGTTTTEACGLCGTRQKVCQNDCRYAVGACKGEPANACEPGKVDFQDGLSCTVGGRQRTCQANCVYTDFGDCFTPGEPDVPSLTVSGTAGQTVTGDFVLTTAEKLPRLSGTCPNADADNAERPSNWIKLINPTGSVLKVTVWTLKSTKPGATVIDTVMASYGKSFPGTPAKREACIAGVIDGCPDGAAGDPGSCLNSWAALYGANAVAIGANSQAYIWVGGYSDSAVGDYQLSARTDTVN
ncbi:MAG: hypothetical protein K0S65_4294 [Labilithrix sp.]|nr:hypothetical protein [Labilithrix sp.]